MRIGQGPGIGFARTAERSADVALLDQLPQLDVHNDVVLEPRSRQSAMAAGKGGQDFTGDSVGH